MNSTPNTHKSTLIQIESSPQIRLDRLTVCFSTTDQDEVTGTCNLLISDKCHSGIAGIKLTSNARYKVRAMIPMPFMTYDAECHPVCFEAGPFHKGLPSYRLDFNPSKLSKKGIDDLMVFLETVTDATSEEFFSQGVVTRVDAAVDLPNCTLDDVIVLGSGKQKHGVYSDRYGTPETTYLGTPRSKRIVAYTKGDKNTNDIGLRLEVRLKPRCFGSDVPALPNPYAKVLLLPVTALENLHLDFPSQLLADSIRVRGLAHALNAFNPQMRALIKKTLLASQSMLPNADQLWAGWPGALTMVGLGKALEAPNPLKLPTAA